MTTSPKILYLFLILGQATFSYAADAANHSVTQHPSLGDTALHALKPCDSDNMREAEDLLEQQAEPRCGNTSGYCTDEEAVVSSNNTPPLGRRLVPYPYYKSSL